jgi:hypothetical protein
MLQMGLRMFGSAFACSLLLACGGVLADNERREVATQVLGGDRFIAGGEVTVGRPVDGDLAVTGGDVDVDTAVAGDMFALGGKLRVGGDVGGSVAAAAGQMTIDGKVGRNLRIAGGRVELEQRSEIAGNLSVGGGRVRLRGKVHGHVLAGGGRVLIDGPVGGDVVVGGGEVELGPNARIAGQLRYRSGKPLRQDPDAQVSGGIEQLPPPANHERRTKAWHGAGAAAAGLLWTLGLVAMAGLLVGLFPNFCGAVARTLREHPGASLLLGFALLVCVPVGVVLLFVTVIGVPLGLVALALYGAMLPVAYVGAALAVGEWWLRRWQPQRAERSTMRFASAAVVLLALSLLAFIPVLGSLVGFLVMLAGLGALLLQVRRSTAAP